MNDLLEINDNKKLLDTDLLFNKNKISNEIASLSSLSSLSSRSSIKSNPKKKLDVKKNLMTSKKYIQSYNDKSDADAEESDDDDAESEADEESEADDDSDADDAEADDSDAEDDESEADDDSDVRSVNGGDIIKKRRNEIAEKREILYQLNRLQAKGHNIPHNFTMASDLNEMRSEYERIVRDKDVDASIRFQRKMLMAFVTGTEYLNSRYDPFAIKLEGWSEQVHENINDYDDIFEELHNKYKAKGKKMAPELRLFISLSGSAFMFHLTSKMFKESSIPVDQL